MRRTTTVLALLLVALSILAGPITPQKAASRIRAFMNRQTWFKGAPVLAYQANRTDGEGCYYYIYTPEQSEGFVIVSGDDRTEGILGYCEEGVFKAEQMPANMVSWLRTYQKAIDQMDKEKTTASSYTPSSEVIPPLMTTRWNQDYPYNMFCPDNCPSGCVATALAQVMYYYRWPQEATTAIPGYTSYSNHYEREELPATTFAWEKMRNSYGNGSSQESREAVALLMEYAGQALEMDYTPSGSGAQTYYIPWVISNYFSYSNSAWVADRSDYSMGEWDELLLVELRAQRPVLYTGYTCTWEGHAFVCDGYDGAGMYHINWGWGGYCDGYYRISLLDPDGSGIGGSSTSDRFNVSQSAIIGLNPEEVETDRLNVRVLSAVERPSVEQSHLTRSSADQDFTGINIYQWIGNATGQGYHSNSGYGLFKDDELLSVVNSQGVFLWPTQITEQSATLSFGANLPDGDYAIYPICNHLDNNQWTKDRAADRHFVRAHISGNELTLTPVPLADFQVNEVRLSGSKMTVNLTNPHEEFNGAVSLYTDDQVIAEEQVAIAAGETTNIYFYIPKEKTLTEADIYYLTVDHYSDNYFYSNGYNTGAELENDIEILNQTKNGDENTVYGGKIYYNINVTNIGSGTYHYTIDIALRDIARDKTSNDKRFIADIAPGETLTIPMQANIAKNMFGKTFQIEMAHKADKETVTTISQPFTCNKGAVLWLEDGEMCTLPSSSTLTVPENVVAAELSAAYTTNVIANSNPNTIYLLGSEVPSGLVGHNVVSSQGTTGKLVLYDNYPYYIPTDIQTSTIYYHRMIESVASGWSTLMLPFAPTNVETTANEVVTWPRGTSDANNAIYLLQPVDVSEKGITLDYVEEMEAFRPYFLAASNAYAGVEVVFSNLQKTTLAPTNAADYHYAMNDGNTLIGTYKQISPWTIYVTEGTQMTYHDEPIAVAPFRTYLHSSLGTSTLPLLLPFAPSTGIDMVESDPTEHSGYIYNMLGQRVGNAADLPSLPHGIYIINGKKTTH